MHAGPEGRALPHERRVSDTPLATNAAISGADVSTCTTHQSYALRISRYYVSVTLQRKGRAATGGSAEPLSARRRRLSGEIHQNVPGRMVDPATPQQGDASWRVGTSHGVASGRHRRVARQRVKVERRLEAVAGMSLAHDDKPQPGKSLGTAVIGALPRADDAQGRARRRRRRRHCP